MWLQLIVVLAAIVIGARLGGIGLGVMGGKHQICFFVVFC